jgi:hypothetical protein
MMRGEWRTESHRLVRCLRPRSIHDIRDLNLNKHTLSIKTTVLQEHVDAVCRTSKFRVFLGIMELVLKFPKQNHNYYIFSSFSSKLYEISDGNPLYRSSLVCRQYEGKFVPVFN